MLEDGAVEGAAINGNPGVGGDVSLEYLVVHIVRCLGEASALYFWVNFKLYLATRLHMIWSR